MQQQAQIRVLVVEDEIVNRDMVCQMLRHFGHQVTAVDGGTAALDAVRKSVHDLVVMDCRMDDMDGLETTRQLRAGTAGPLGRTIPVIALTAQAFVTDRDACLAAGMNDFLTKPVDIHNLMTAVEHWGRHKAGTDADDPTQAAGQSCTPVAAPQIFDPGVLAALPMVADGSQPHYSQIVLDMYFKSLPDLLSVIRQAANTGDTQKAQRAAHSLKSSSAAVGAFAMAACAANAEAHLRFGHQDMAHLPPQFDTEFERLCTLLGRQHAPVQKAQYHHAEPC
ncbi:MAG TPA: response regulator [Aquabacterium sp.]|uniref:Hpt domain-containing response regulator n=1 Tax=Aquabacterium sp. TaxID=1872578 RepID=UPI002E307B07|nr:response regulator [Aquabacterium sp.]HEX5355067.1 response regulator [Aquabacterium sp.]